MRFLDGVYGKLLTTTCIANILRLPQIDAG